MSKPHGDGARALNISAVERETALSKDVLRMWERRYDFPKPARDENGERQYSVAEIAKLRSIKRLMDAGMRPGRIIMRTQAELNALCEERSTAHRDPAEPALERGILDLLRAHDAPALQQALSNLVMKGGLQRLVVDTLAPLNRAVSEAWIRGDLQLFEEHLYIEQVTVVLRAAINPLPRTQGTPRVLLTTLPGEQHGLGLLMVEALLVSEGAHCLSLGTQTPIEDIRLAALAHKAQLIALSFSGSFPVRQAGESLAALRRQIPPQISLWAAGEMTRRIRRTLHGVVLVPEPAAGIGALKTWRSHAPPATESYAGDGAG